MKLILLATLTLLTSACTTIAQDAASRDPAAAEGGWNTDFLSGVKPMKIPKSEVMAIIVNTVPDIKEGIDKSGVQLLDVQDTGLRWRCNCYDVLVKLTSPMHAVPEIRLYRIEGNKVVPRT